MSARIARVHTKSFNRAKPSEAVNKKVVFKPNLDNPFQIQWPCVPINLQNSILARLVSLLNDISSHRSSSHEVQIAKSKKKRKHCSAYDAVARDTVAKSVEELSPPNFENGESSQTGSLGPGVESTLAIFSHATFGLNEVTKKLEFQVQNVCRPVILSTKATGMQKEAKIQPLLKFVFVCRSDVPQPLLIDHLPHLVAAYNSAKTVKMEEVVKLVPLPKGAEEVLSQALGFRRLSVLALDATFSEFPSLLSLIESVPTLTAPWLSNLEPTKRFVATHIKHLRTSAPKDIKAVKELRAQGKASAKRQKISSDPREKRKPSFHAITD